MQQYYLARQPILDNKEKLCAFELLFRSSDSSTKSNVTDDTSATAQVMLNAFGELGISNTLGTYKGFINLGSHFLYSDTVELLSKEQVILELLESVVIDSAIIARCHELKAMGFSLALDDVLELNDEIKPLLDIVDVIKLDISQIPTPLLPQVVRGFKRYPVKLLAEKVETRKQVRYCMELGFDLFQGYYFARPEMLSGKRADPAKAALLQILSLILSDADDEKVVNAFKGYPDLAYSLLRLVNSAGIGLSTKISSLSHALMILGRRAMQRWAQLLLYASKESGAANPLMQLAATRARLMELIATRLFPNDPNYADRAFMAGMLSLLDTLMDEPLSELIPRLNLQEDIESALLSQKGDMGEMLILCGDLESYDARALKNTLCARPGITMDDVNQAHMEALSWANNITHSLAN